MEAMDATELEAGGTMDEVEEGGTPQDDFGAFPDSGAGELEVPPKATVGDDFGIGMIGGGRATRRGGPGKGEIGRAFGVNSTPAFGLAGSSLCTTPQSAIFSQDATRP